MYVYVQTEKGCAVLGEHRGADSIEEMLALIELYKPRAQWVLAEGDLHCFGCGTKVPDPSEAPLTRNGTYNFGNRKTIGGFTLVPGGKK